MATDQDSANRRSLLLKVELTAANATRPAWIYGAIVASIGGLGDSVNTMFTDVGSEVDAVNQ